MPIRLRSHVLIKSLSPRLANQIAAGGWLNVRPGHQELVENALDAGARRIDIDVEEGGVTRFTCVMMAAGSKRGFGPCACASCHQQDHYPDDLEAVATLGFRGEALASICSVSRLSLTSCYQGCAEGWCHGRRTRPQTAQLAPAAHTQGSTVEVRDLFYNTPARRKFCAQKNRVCPH